MLSISVAVYNLPELTRRCFESLDRTIESQPFEVLVYDNHSTDPGMDALYAALDPARYKVVRANANIGYRGAHRENARRFTGEWLVIINNDILFEERGWDRKLVRRAGLGAVGVRGDVCNALDHQGVGYYDPRAVRAPMFVDGHFMAIPHEVIRTEGLFEDEQIAFCYFEDSDHSFTLRHKGYAFDFVSIGLTHFRGSTVRSLSAEERLFLQQTFDHNRWRFVAKWGAEVARIRATLSWDHADTGACPKSVSRPTAVPPAAARLIQRGLHDHQAGRLAAAETQYVKALRTSRTPLPAADNLLAALMMETARAADALTHARRAVRAEPGNPFYLATLGNAEQASGRIPDAFRTYLCARTLNPSDEYVTYNLGRLCLQNRMPEEAAGFYLKAIAAAPAMLEARYGLGRALIDLERFDDAVAVLGVVVKAAPGHADAALALSRLYLTLARYEEAEAVLRAAVVHLPDHPGVHNNLGVALHRLGDFAGAGAAFATALRHEPLNPEFLSNTGMSRAAVADLDGAIAAYRLAIHQSPDYADAHWNLALALLLRGEYVEGWREYRWGSRTVPPRATPRHFDRPAWEGTDPSGQRILLYGEQGYGDTFQFVRYASMIHNRGGEVIFQCQRGLLELLSRVPGVRTLVEDGQALPDFDLHASIFDAPRVLGTTPDTIPAPLGYITADEVRTEQWREALAGLRGLKVGLTWQGRAAHGHDRLRSIPLQALAPLLDAPGVSFVSLQKGHGSEQIAATAFADRIVDHTHTWDASGEPIFVDAAAVIANLDLVITVDSAIAHLAGAMGRPVWTYIQHAPDWRWGLEGDRSAWYPSMRLFRQTEPGDWAGPIERTAAALAARSTPLPHSAPASSS
ncbi:MAG: tetratricopeptide repeat protein [Vicinamibacterales bacterium]